MWRCNRGVERTQDRTKHAVRGIGPHSHYLDRMGGDGRVPGAGGGERVGCAGQSEKSGSTRRRCGGGTGV